MDRRTFLAARWRPFSRCPAPLGPSPRDPGASGRSPPRRLRRMDTSWKRSATASASSATSMGARSSSRRDRGRRSRGFPTSRAPSSPPTSMSSAPPGRPRPAAKAATKSIPIIFGRAAFPDKTGLIRIDHPGGNLTGVTFIGPDTESDWSCSEVSPRISRLRCSTTTTTRPACWRSATRDAAKTLQVTRRAAARPRRRHLQAAFAAIRHGKAEAVITTAAAAGLHRVQVMEFVNEQRLVSMYGDRIRPGRWPHVLWDQRHGHVAARGPYVDDILGATPGEPPGGAADAIRADDQPEDREGPAV